MWQIPLNRPRIDERAIERVSEVAVSSRKLADAGFETVRSTSFMTLLLPVMLLSRRRARSLEAYDPLAELRIGKTLNTVLSGILAIERAAIAAGIDLPVGGSRLVVARKAG